MASIGRPQLKNTFSKISKHVAKDLSGKESKTAQKRALSDSLNRAAGRKIEDQFVDKKKHNKLGKDGFLKLLAHQMQHQDPMKPMDQKQFAADLAQFSQLEQLTNMNKSMDKLSGNQPSENKFYGASFLGKEVITKGTSIEHNGHGKVSQIPFFLPKNASKLMVRIFDKHNQIITQINAEDIPQGNRSVKWDGLTNDGTHAVKGEYRIDVKAWDKNFEEIKPETQSKGIVTGVNFVNGETILELGQKQIFLRDVLSFKLPKITESSLQSGSQINSKNATNRYNQVNEQGL